MEHQHIPENIKFLILKQRSSPLSDTELAILEAWYAEELPEELYWYGDTRESLKDRLFASVESQMELDNVRTLNNQKSPLWRIAACVAALLLCVLGGYVYKQRADKPLLAVESEGDRITKIILPDQTIVWLKGDSKLRYPKSFSGKTREVELIGEGLFEVTKDSSRPFIIHAGDYATEVLGTSFNLKLDPDNGEIDLAVLTGQVEVSKKGKGLRPTKRYAVSANEVLRTVPVEGEKTDKLASKVEIAKLLKGTEYDMNFVSAPVEDIMSRFEKKFDVSFEGYTGEYNSCNVTADLTDQSLETSLKILSLAINAQFKVQDNTIKLTGGGCF